MSGIYLKIGADFEKMRALQAELVRLRTELKSTSQAADPKAFERLTSQINRTQAEYTRLSQNVSKASRSIREDMRGVEGGAGSLHSMLLKLGGVAALAALGKQVIEVRGEFQKLEIAFTTLLRSKEKAEALMAQMIETAAKTPFSMQGVAGGARQLLAYGFAAEDVNDTLIRLGNIASGLGLPLERLTYLYGTTRTQGRLYARDMMQFTTSGIPMLQGLADMFGKTTAEVSDMVSAGKIGFPEVEKYIMSLTEKGGMFYNLMEEQSKSFTGQISNIKDAVEVALDEMGEKNEGVINKGLQLTKSAIENYDKVGRSLAALVVTYGAYRVAVALAAESLKGYTVAQTLQIRATIAAEAATKALNRTMLANPYVLAAVALVGLVAGVWALSKADTAAEKAAKDHAAMRERLAEKEEEHKGKIEQLITTATNAYMVDIERQKALEELKKEYPKIFEQYDIERLKLADILQLKREIAAQDADSSVKENSKRYDSQLAIVKGLEDKLEKQRKTNVEGGMSSTVAIEAIKRDLEGARASLRLYEADIEKDRVAAWNLSIKDMSKAQIDAELAARKRLSAAIDASGKEKAEGRIVGLGAFSKSELETQTKSLEAELKKRSEAVYTHTQLQKKYTDELLVLEKQLDDLKKKNLTEAEFKKQFDEVTGNIEAVKGKMRDIGVSGKKGADEKEQEKAQKDYEKAVIDQQRKLENDTLDLKKVSTTDKIALINLERDAAIAAIRKEQEEYEKQAKDSGVESPDTSVFIKRIEVQNQLAAEKSRQVQEEADKKQREDKQKVLESLVDQYKTFDGRRLALDAEYTADQQALNDALLKATTQAEKDAIQDTLTARKAAYQEGLATLESEALQSTGFYQELFKEITDLGYRSLNDLARRTMEVVTSARYSKAADGRDMVTIDVPSTDAAGNQVKKAVTITVEEFTRLQEKAQQVSKAIEDRNPFEALSKAIDKYNAAKGAGDKNAMSDSMEQIAKSASGTMGQIAEWGSMIGSVFGEDVDQGLNQLMNLMGGVTDLGVGVGRIAAGDVLGGVTQAASGLVTVVTQIVEINKQQEAQQFALMVAEIEYQRLLDDRRVKLIESRNELAAYANDVELLNDLIKAGYLEEGAADYWSELTEKLKLYQDSVRKERANQDKLWGKVQGSNWEESGWAGLNYYHYTNPLKGMDKDQIELLYRQGKLTKEAEKYYEQWKASGEEVDKLTGDIALTHEEMASLVTGMNFDEFLDGAMENLQEMRSGVKSLATFTEDTLRAALLSAFKYQVLAEAMQPLYDELANALINETGNKEFYERWGSTYSEKMTALWDQLSSAFEAAGISMADMNASSGSSRGFQAMSQDTGDALEGRFAALQMSGVNIENRTMEMSQDMKVMMAEQVTQSDELRKQNQWLEESRNIQLESLAQLTDIAKYTKVLPEMADDIKEIKNNTDGLS